MGGSCSRTKPKRFLFQGLDAAGKTSILYKLKLGEVVTTIPTIGFNVESITSGGVEFTGWDLGGRDKMRPLFRHYYANTDGVIYVIDSTDYERLDEAIEELDRMVLSSDDLRDTTVMVLANKQDLEKSMSPADVEARIKDKCCQGMGVSYFVMPCSVYIDDSVIRVFDFFAKQVKLKQEGRLPNGLISRAWETASREEDEDKSKMNGDGNSSMMHIMKTSFFKNPLSLLKSALFY